MKNLKHVFNFDTFLNEAKKTEKNDLTIFEKNEKAINLFIKDVEETVDIFDKMKNIEYTYDKEGYPKTIEFEITEQDYKLKYDDSEEIIPEYTEGVAKKREFLPIIIFDEKFIHEKNEKNDKIYKIKFKIKKEKVKIKEEIKFDPKEETTDSLFRKLDSKKYFDERKAIIKELKKRGEEVEDYLDDEE